MMATSRRWRSLAALHRNTHRAVQDARAVGHMSHLDTVLPCDFNHLPKTFDLL
jgi:hypothetical protein